MKKLSLYIFLKSIFIFSLSILFVQPSLAEEIDQAKFEKMIESCADNSFKDQFGQKYNDYLEKSEENSEEKSEENSEGENSAKCINDNLEPTLDISKLQYSFI